MFCVLSWPNEPTGWPDVYGPFVSDVLAGMFAEANLPKTGQWSVERILPNVAAKAPKEDSPYGK
jgi:hypothetical protein